MQIPLGSLLRPVEWFLACAIGVLIGILAIWYFWQPAILSPIDPEGRFRFWLEGEPDPSEGKIVYGFLPYWNMNQVLLQPELTHLAYFALDIRGDGSIRTRDKDGNAEPGFRRLGSQRWWEVFESHQGQTELVFTQFESEAISAFLTSPAAHDRFITELDSILLSYPISGINIDIELSGSASPALRSGLTEFMVGLRNHLDSRYQGINLSIDVYAGAASRQQLWEIEKLEPLVDHFVVMAYDFHQRSSANAGPVAPIFGGQEFWDSDIHGNLRAFLEKVPPEKILMGIPFYGYEWQTTSRQAQAHTFPQTGATATYKRIQELLDSSDPNLQVKEHWNATALSPYISYQRDGQIFVIYYDNSRSLSYKLDLVNQLDLAGIAIWALGYEGENRELWEVIGRKL